MTAPLDLADLERLEREASAPPWSVKTYQDESGEHNPYASWDLWGEENMTLVVALRNAFPAIRDELHRLRARNEELREELIAIDASGYWHCAVCEGSWNHGCAEEHGDGCLAAPEGATE